MIPPHIRFESINDRVLLALVGVWNRLHTEPRHFLVTLLRRTIAEAAQGAACVSSPGDVFTNIIVPFAEVL